MLPDIDLLLKQSVAMHDAETHSINEETMESTTEIPPSYSGKYPEELFSKEVLRQLLESQEFPDDKTRVLASAVFDNVMDEHVFKKVGTNESLVDSDLSLWTEIKSQKKAISNEMGYSNYFSFYLASNGYDLNEVLDEAERSLEETQDYYNWAFRKIFGSNSSTLENMTRLELDFGTNPKTGSFSLEKTLSTVVNLTENLFGDALNQYLNINLTSEKIRSYVYFFLNERRSTLTMSKEPGFRSYINAHHGIGHAYFPLLNQAEPYFTFNNDIAWTESLAFITEHIATSDVFLKEEAINVCDNFKEFNQFLPIYYERLYAARTLFYHEYYNETCSFAKLEERFKSSLKQALALDMDRIYVDFRPTAVEFVKAYQKSRALSKQVSSLLSNGDWNSLGQFVSNTYATGNKTLCKVKTEESMIPS